MPHLTIRQALGHTLPSTYRKEWYTKDEKEVLRPFKDRWTAVRGAEARANVLREVALALFSFRQSRGVPPVTDQEAVSEIEKLMAWMLNNWRVPKKVADPWKKTRSTVFTVMQREMRNEIKAEVERLRNMEEYNSLGNIGLESKARSFVYRGLDEGRRAELQAIVDRESEEGFSPERQLALASEYGYKRIAQEDGDRWLEMGMLSLTCIVRQKSEGKWAVEIMDNIARNLKVTDPGFEAEFPDVSMQLRRAVVNYVDRVSSKAGTAGRTEFVSSDSIHLHGIPSIALNGNGYPVLPENPGTTLRLTKVGLDKYLRQYIGAHLFQATGRSSGKNIPWTQIEKFPGQIVENEYLAPGITLRDPSRMSTTDIKSCLDHCYQRQLEFGPESSFRFRKIVGVDVSPITGHPVLLDARYGQHIDELRRQRQNARRAERRRKAKKVTGESAERPEPVQELNGLLSLSPSRSASPPPAQTEMTPSVATGTGGTTTQPNILHIGPDFHPQAIDPVLQDARVPPHPRAQETESLTSGPADQDLNASTVTAGSNDLVRVGWAEMSTMIANGWAIPAVRTGPREGLPSMLVPHGEVNVFLHGETSEIAQGGRKGRKRKQPDSNIGPGPVRRSRRTAKENDPVQAAGRVLRPRAIVPRK